MREMLLSYIKRYPKMLPQDAVLFIAESAYGEMHKGLVYEVAVDIEKEGNELSVEQLEKPYSESLGGGFCRINLSVLQVIPATLLAKMIMASEDGVGDKLYNKGIKTLISLCNEGHMPFSANKLSKYISKNISKEYFSCSDIFRKAYLPAYRVVSEEFGTYLNLFVKISRRLYSGGEVTVAIDGQSAAGKTYLSNLLKKVFDCNVFHTKDFNDNVVFNADRFKKEICSKLNTGKPFVSRYKDKEVSIMPNRLNVVEGTYCFHPKLLKYYEIKVFMGISPLLQSQRILKRDGEKLFRHFANDLIPRENAYIENMKTELQSDISYYKE